MEIIQQKNKGLNILVPVGKLDSVNSVEFEKLILSLIASEADKKFLVDFSQVDYISSAGLRTLLLAAKEAKPLGGVVHLCAMNDCIKSVFEVTGFTSIFKIFVNVDEVLKIEGI